MPEAIFSLSIMAAVGMLLLPVLTQTRSKAVYAWVVNGLTVGAASLALEKYYPSWEEPQWHSSGAIWFWTSWAFCLVGFIIAIRKPQKRNASATQ